MRKDLKIGLAIGAVLLVVLIVYMAVPKSGHPAQDGATLAQGEPGTDAAPAEQAADAGSAPTDGAPAVAPPGESEVASAAAGKPAGGQEDPFAPNAPQADASNAGAGERPGDRATEKGTNWAKLLESGELPASTTSTPSLSASHTTGGSAAETPAPVPAAAKVTDAPAAQQDATPAAPTSTIKTESTEPASTTTVPVPDGSSQAKPTSAPAGGARTHKVAHGETFSSIAKALYGDDRHYIAIQNANPDIDPARLKPGTVISLPDASAVKPRGTAAADDRAVTAGGRQERELDPSKEYKVKPGDNLHDIAKRIYHASTMSDEIYELNKETIGDNPAKLKAGTILKLPAKPTTEPSASVR